MATLSFSHVSLASSSSPSKINSRKNLPNLILNLGVTSSSHILPSIFSSSRFFLKPLFLKPMKTSPRMEQKYTYPDPIPEFAESETKKFRFEILNKLSKNKDSFEGDLDKVVDVCSEIFSNFLHKEYGGPGTLLIEPFTDMLVALKEKKLAGAPMAAREALFWAQNYLDEDWETWTKNLPK
ncbi:hypothetical protein C5167_006406 [Papaver somniferum]|uniref:Uncharacterized protein n=1 Tax=Papaver somniferum TaxID=3469 RepID=A0A4Y7JE72_PAPSO|nr:protein PLASTID REDOX INSENSITIVE 2, chloroplastic-like [Papaver somniferum]RZC59107.1 hypothetical protein C5167_006406 [Papaver somniferum]